MKQIFMFAISFSLISFTHGYFLPMHKHLRMHNKHDSKFKHDHVSSNGIVKIDCGTQINKNEISHAKYSLHTNRRQPCYVSIPTHVFIAINANFYDSLSSVHLLAGNNGHYTINSPKIYAKNASLPYKTHREDRAHVYFVPCNKAAIVLDAYHPNDYITFQFLEVLEHEKMYEDYDKSKYCFNGVKKNLMLARVG